MSACPPALVLLALSFSIKNVFHDLADGGRQAPDADCLHDRQEAARRRRRPGVQPQAFSAWPCTAPAQHPGWGSAPPAPGSVRPVRRKKQSITGMHAKTVCVVHQVAIESRSQADRQQIASRSPARRQHSLRSLRSRGIRTHDSGIPGRPENNSTASLYATRCTTLVPDTLADSCCYHLQQHLHRTNPIVPYWF